MATPIPYDFRLKIVRDRKSGKTYKQIAEALGYSESGVKKIWRRYQADGLEGLQTNYSNCGRRSPYGEEVRQLIESVRDGDQGADYVRSVLLEKEPNKTIPHERTIQRWWKAKGTNSARGRRKEKDKSGWTDEVHHTWQIDGKEQVRLKSGEQVSWLNIADEASGSELQAGVSPPQDDE